MATSSRSGGLFAAVCLLSSLSTASFSQAATLAEWTLTGTLYNEPSVPADTLTRSPALSSASLARESSLGKQNSNVTGYGGKGFDSAQTYEAAVDGKKYFDVILTTAANYSVEPTKLTFKYTSTSLNGPGHARLLCFTNGVECMTFEEGSIKNTGNQTTTNISLSAIGHISPGTTLTLRLYVWGAQTPSATFVFKDSMIFEGTATETSGGGGDEPPDPVPLSVLVENFGTIYAGVQSGVPLTFAGDNAVLDISADKEISGTTNYVNGVFSFTPDDADIGKTFTFTATVSDSTGVNNPVSEAFTATVVEKVWVEGFEAFSKQGYYTSPTEVQQDAAKWQGTNFQFKVATSDIFRDSSAVVFQRGLGYIEMVTDKPNGAGSISFEGAIRSNAPSAATASFLTYVSNNGGVSWVPAKTNSVGEIVSQELVKADGRVTFSLENVNIGGAVRLRFVCQTSENDTHVTLDDIMITDYDGAAEMDPAIGQIGDFDCYVDEPCTPVSVVFFGNDAAGTQTNIAATAGVDDSEYSLVDGVFNFTPTEADLHINGGVIEFTITLEVPGKETATRTFHVTVKPAPLRFLSLAPSLSPAEDFDSLGAEEGAKLPPPWRVAHSNGAAPDYTLSYALATNTTTRRATTAAGSISTSFNTGIYNLGTNETDRAVGFVSGGDAYQTCALMVPVKNVSSRPVPKIAVSYSVEKWRKGVGKRLALYVSTDGASWTAAEGFETVTKTDYSAGTDVDTAAYPLGEAKTIANKKNIIVLAEPLAAGNMIYLGWFYTCQDKSDNGAKGQCLGVDNIKIRIGDDKTVIIVR